MGELYWEIGLAFGSLAGIVVFFGVWAGILMIYDFPRGMLVGWLPGIIAAAFAFGLSYISWPLIVISIVSFIFLVLYELNRP